jgi:hypothetical protein
MANTKGKAVLFGLMGHDLTGHSGTINILPQSTAEKERSKLSMEWRQDYSDSDTAC